MHEQENYSAGSPNRDTRKQRFPRSQSSQSSESKPIQIVTSNYGYRPNRNWNYSSHAHTTSDPSQPFFNSRNPSLPARAVVWLGASILSVLLLAFVAEGCGLVAVPLENEEREQTEPAH